MLCSDYIFGQYEKLKKEKKKVCEKINLEIFVAIGVILIPPSRVFLKLLPFPVH